MAVITVNNESLEEQWFGWEVFAHSLYSAAASLTICTVADKLLLSFIDCLTVLQQTKNVKFFLLQIEFNILCVCNMRGVGVTKCIKLEFLGRGRVTVSNEILCYIINVRFSFKYFDDTGFNVIIW